MEKTSEKTCEKCCDAAQLDDPTAQQTGDFHVPVKLRTSTHGPNPLVRKDQKNMATSNVYPLVN